MAVATNPGFTCFTDANADKQLWWIYQATVVNGYQFANAPSSAAILTATGDVFTLAAGEIGFIQNLDTDPLFVRRATGASATAFHEALAAGAVADDGKGGKTEIRNHIGVVSVFGTTPRYIAWKVSP